MGATQSDSDKCDIVSLHYKEVYSDLLSRCPMSFKDGFISLLGGQSAELGEKLYQYLFYESDRDSCCPTEVDCDKFIIAMTKLHTMISCSKKEFSQFFFSLFSESTESDLETALYTAATCALHIGLSNELSIPNKQPVISAMITSMMQYSGQHKEESQVTNFQQWLGMHSPHVLTGVIQWLYAIILPSSEKRLTYHLPVIECKEEERLLQLNVIMWVLSGVLPTLFLGASPSQVKEREVDDLPCGGIWTSLYSSKDHGFSMNRFQHHCFDYKQPSIMIMNCHNQREKLLYSFAIAMDSEWRDGTYFYGGSNFHFIQLQPIYSLLKKGAKLVSVNEKQRGFPNGLRIMASQKYDYCLFEVKSSLAEARLREGEWMKVEFMEVWGCGGMQARETQLRIKEWESREVLRRRQINNKDMRTTWQDNPDRYLLEMGGVTATSAETD